MITSSTLPYVAVKLFFNQLLINLCVKGQKSEMSRDKNKGELFDFRPKLRKTETFFFVGQYI